MCIITNGGGDGATFCNMTTTAHERRPKVELWNRGVMSNEVAGVSADGETLGSTSPLTSGLISSGVVGTPITFWLLESTRVA